MRNSILHLDRANRILVYEVTPAAFFPSCKVAPPTKKFTAYDLTTEFTSVPIDLVKTLVLTCPYVMVMLRLCYGYFMVMLWLFYGYVMAMLWLCYGYGYVMVMAMLWLCYGYVMVMFTMPKKPAYRFFNSSYSSLVINPKSSDYSPLLRIHNFS